MLADHAWLIEACTRLFELDGDGAWLDRATANATAMIRLFSDGEVPSHTEPERGGGFFTTGSDAEVLLARSKEVFDGALPSASAVTASALARLAALRGDADLRAIAQRTVDLLSSILDQHPMAVPDLVLALGWLEHGLELAVPGPRGPLLEAATAGFSPFTVIAHGSSDRCAILEHRQAGLAYVCRNRVCDRPTDDPAALVAQLRAAVQG
jgi:uncharacterized protein YyaL (SSP411 family)